MTYAGGSMWRRRWRLFKSQKRAVISALFLAALSFFSLTAELWSNDRPLVLSTGGQLYYPVFQHVRPEALGISDSMVVDYKNLRLSEDGWALWPLNRWDPYRTNKLAKEFPSAPDHDNWFGTDDRGRDVFARLLYGFRYSLIFSVAVWALCSLMALLYGGICGYLGGWTDLIGQRAVEILSTVPQLLLLIFVISIFEPSMTLLVVVSCAFGWIGLSYFVRGEVFRTRCLEYVEAARALGASPKHVLMKCILPNCVLPLITFAPFMIVANLTGLAGLDFLGLGLPAPTPSWGELLQQAQTYFTWAWWLAFFPAFILFLTLLSLTLLGEGVRLALDPNAKLEPLPEPECEPVGVRATAGRLGQRTGRVLQAPAAQAALLIACFLGAVWLSSAHADVNGTVNAETFRQVASDPLNITTTRMNFFGNKVNRIVQSWGTSVELIEGGANYVQFQGNKAAAWTSLRAGKTSHVTLTAGLHDLRDRFPPDTSQQNKQDLLAPDISQEAQSVLSDRMVPYYAAEFYTTNPNIWEWNFKLTHDYVYQEWVSPAAACHFLTWDKLYSRLEWIFVPRWRVRLSGNFAPQSDSNSRTETDNSLMWEAVNGRHWILFGVGAYTVGFQHPTNDYWSPRQFNDFQLKSEAALHWSRAFSSNVSFNYGYGGEQGGEQGFDYYFDARLNYSIRSVMGIGAGYTRIKSLRSDKWERNDFNVTLSASL